MDDYQQGREQESALIGSVLKRPAIYEELAELVTPESFGWKAYASVWVSFSDVIDAGITPDILTIGDELERRGQLETFILHDTAQYSGRSALSKLKETGDPANAKSYAENILDYSAKWRMAQLFRTGYVWAVNGRRAADIMQDMSQKMGEIHTAGGASNRTQTLAEATGVAYDETDRASRGEVQFIQSGYIDIDGYLNGFSEPDLLIIAGRPGTGKTAFFASLIKNIYDAQPDKRMMVFSLEMSNQQIAKRLIAMESGVSFDRQKSGRLKEDEWPPYLAAIEKLGDKKNIFLNDLPAISPNRIRQELRRVGDIDMVIVDYIQIASADGKSENRTQEVGKISRGLKAIAKDFQVPVLAAAQLSRAVESRASNEPQLSDLRESGDIEADADIVLMLYREEKDPTMANITHVKIAKHRNGPVGTIDLLYRANLTRFENAIGRKVPL